MIFPWMATGRFMGNSNSWESHLPVPKINCFSYKILFYKMDKDRNSFVTYGDMGRSLFQKHNINTIFGSPKKKKISSGYPKKKNK